MIQVNQPVKCPKCGRDMISYSINSRTGKMSFTCSRNITHVLELDEKEYRKAIKNNGI